MKKLAHIILGWGKALGIIQVTSAELKLSQLRMKICSKCELSKPSKTLKILNNSAEYEHSLKCIKCTCPCLEKSLVVDEKCPIGKW